MYIYCQRVQLVKNGESTLETDFNRSYPKRSTMTRKLFDKNFAPYRKYFLREGAEMCFFFSIFSFFAKCRQKCCVFYVNSSGSKEPQKMFSNFLTNFSPNYVGLKILSSHFAMIFQRCNGIFFFKKSIIYPQLYHKNFKKFRVLEHYQKKKYKN